MVDAPLAAALGRIVVAGAIGPGRGQLVDHVEAVVDPLGAVGGPADEVGRHRRGEQLEARRPAPAT